MAALRHDRTTTVPASVVRLSAGRTEMSGELQASCLHAGAHSIVLADEVNTPSSGNDHGSDLLDRLGVRVADGPLLR